MKLYVYDHCPFCTKARMIFGLKNVPVTQKFLMNDDEDTPVALIGKKMLPILVKEDGQAMGESMDIVHYIDANYGSKKLLTQNQKPELQSLVDEFSGKLLPLYLATNAMAPFQEFITTSARIYYTKKKEAFVGAFSTIFTEKDQHLTALNTVLNSIEAILPKDFHADSPLDETDIHLYAILRGSSVISGLIFQEKTLNYMHVMEKRTQVPLLFHIAG